MSCTVYDHHCSTVSETGGGEANPPPLLKKVNQAIDAWSFKTGHYLMSLPLHLLPPASPPPPSLLLPLMLLLPTLTLLSCLTAHCWIMSSPLIDTQSLEIDYSVTIRVIFLKVPDNKNESPKNALKKLQCQYLSQI